MEMNIIQINNPNKGAKEVLLLLVMSGLFIHTRVSI